MCSAASSIELIESLRYKARHPSPWSFFLVSLVSFCFHNGDAVSLGDEARTCALCRTPVLSVAHCAVLEQLIEPRQI